MKLVVGLGNPGRQYANHRHNIGFMTIDQIALDVRADSLKRKYNAQYAHVAYEDNDMVLVKPLTFMNLSGTSVRAFADYFKIPAEDVLIIVDDVHLNFGKIRVRANGSSGGHNGIKSVIGELGTKDFARVRIGVSHPPDAVALEDYVLSNFDEKEKNDLPKIISLASEVALAWVRRGAHSVMQQYN
jgi:PTH1 family peptidyl-tRNA hydrolase